MAIFREISGILHKSAVLSTICIAVLLFPHQANTQEIADTPCDEVYFDSLEARAWLEAQREITQNQNLIFKADSVLEYTCFDKFANVLAREALTMFSENSTRWGAEILDDQSMDRALDALVGGAISNWVSLNFGHSFLGGRMDGPDSDYSPGSISGGSYGCSNMDNVWFRAKCVNFAENENEDGFYTFEHYAESPDKRHLPERCLEGQPEPRWDGMLRAAITTTLGGNKSRPEWPQDPLKVVEGLMNNENCGVWFTPPMPTGIIVRRPVKQPREYEEKVCFQTGCTYVPTSRNDGSCVSN